MLQAIARNKINRFLSSPELPEDVLTDCVFGGLRYLAPAEAGSVLACVLSEEPPSFVDLGRQRLTGLEVLDAELWPARKGGREPDGLLRCRTADGKLLAVLLEAKWRRSALAERQAADQWEHFGMCEFTNGGDALHAFVVENRRAALRALEIDDEDFREAHGEEALRIWRGKRVVVVWYDVAKRLRRNATARGSEQLLRWIEDVLAVLRRLGKRPFDGFQRTLIAGSVDVPSPGSFFGRHSRRRYRWPDASVSAPPRPLFWLTVGGSTD